MPIEYNDDCRSGMLYVGINEDSDFLKYFVGDEVMGAIARRYNIQETSDGDRSGCFFKVPIGEEVAYHEHLMKDEAIGYVEYVINGVPELSDKIDEAISDLKDLSADIFSCSTKVGVDALIQERIDGLERLRL